MMEDTWITSSPTSGNAPSERPLRLVRMMEAFAERGLDQEVTDLAGLTTL